LDTECAAQSHFSFRHEREICLDFEGGEITSDAGLVALREFDHRIGFTESLVACLHDDRHPSYVTHELVQLIIQRLYGIVAGYEGLSGCLLGTFLRRAPRTPLRISWRLCSRLWRG